VQASIALFFLAGSSAPTPLYAVYQAAWGFSPITVTVIFGIYALSVLAALLVTGSLSDHVGRRPVLFATALLQAAAMTIFAVAGSVGALLAARVVQGLATGAAASAVGAGMLDLDRRRGAIANAVAPLVGTASGGLISGLFAAHLPAPTVLVYVGFALLFVAQARLVLALPETVVPRPGALLSLRPRLRVPPSIRGALLVAGPALVAAWALAGFYGSLGPSLVRTLAGSSSVVLGGTLLFALAGSGALTVLFSHARPARAVLGFGTAVLATGVAVSLRAIGVGSLWMFFAGTVIAGAGFGASFHAAIRSVLFGAAAHERAGVLSVLYVIAYLALGLPAVVAGVRVVHGGGVLGTAGEYGLGVIILAGLASVSTLATHILDRSVVEPMRGSP
jgi:hypothetical protein